LPRSRLLASARIPDTEIELKLHEHRDRFAISIPGCGELMNTRVHGSEIALAERALKRAPGRDDRRVLIGGLGMGFTLAAALRGCGPGAEVVVSELVPEVVDWNREFVGEASGHPLSDSRVRVHVGDVAEVLRAAGSGFDVILMDVDDGPAGLIRRENDWLYGPAGLAAAHQALRPAGVLAVWSATPDDGFTRRLRSAGFGVDTETVRPHRAGRGARHTLWFAVRRGCG